MFDRLLMPALTFTMLLAALAAFVADLAPSGAPPSQLVRLEQVVVHAQRELPLTPLARADATASVTVLVR